MTRSQRRIVGLVVVAACATSSGCGGGRSSVSGASETTLAEVGSLTGDDLLDAIRDAGVPIEGCLPDGSSCIYFEVGHSAPPIATFMRLDDAIVWANVYPDIESAEAAAAARRDGRPDALVARCRTALVSIEHGDPSDDIDQETDFMPSIIDAIEPLVGRC